MEIEFVSEIVSEFIICLLVCIVLVWLPHDCGVVITDKKECFECVMRGYLSIRRIKIKMAAIAQRHSNENVRTYVNLTPQ